MTDAKSSSIETEHGVPGTLLMAFKDALAREFPDQEESMKKVMRRIVQTFKEIADTVIHFDSARGAAALLKRLKQVMVTAKTDMTTLIAARLEGEHGAHAAATLRHAVTFDVDRYPADFAGVITQLAKSASRSVTPRTGVVPRPKRAAPTNGGPCQWCGEMTGGNFAAHNKTCTGKPAEGRKKKRKIK